MKLTTPLGKSLACDVLCVLLLSVYVHTTTTHHTPHTTTPQQPPPPHHHPSALLFLSSPLSHFFIHTKENNRLPFDTQFFANLHDDRLRSKIGKIQMMLGTNIMHTVTALNRRKTEGNQTVTVIKVSQRLIKTRLFDETPKKQRLQNADQNLANKT